MGNTEGHRSQEDWTRVRGAHMSKSAIRLGAVALASAAALSAGATAGAATPSPPSLSAIQAKARADINLRVNDLNAAIQKVNGAKHLGSDQQSLDTYLQRDIAPLQALETKIDNDTSVTQAEQDYATIFSDFRVLALVLPAARQAADADVVTTAAAPALTSDSGKAQSHVNSTNQSTLQPMINSLNTDISGATAAASGVAGTVMSDVPSQWNANHSLLSPTKDKLSTAKSDVKNAVSELRQIHQYLESSRSAGPRTTTPTTTAG
jgi:hypothetical protein